MVNVIHLSMARTCFYFILFCLYNWMSRNRKTKKLFPVVLKLIAISIMFFNRFKWATVVLTLVYRLLKLTLFLSIFVMWHNVVCSCCLFPLQRSTIVFMRPLLIQVLGLNTLKVHEKLPTWSRLQSKSK